MKRKFLNFDDFFAQMIENNFGAMTVIKKMKESEGDKFVSTILQLDDMNIRGSQLWVGYKDYCGEDIELFIKCVKDPEEKQALCDAINITSAKGECGENYKAVIGGARYQDPESIRLSEKEMKELSEKPRMIHPEAKKKQEEFGR